MTQIATVAEARALIEARKVYSRTDVHVSRYNGARTTSYRWYMVTGDQSSEQVTGWSARRLTQASRAIQLDNARASRARMANG